MIERLLIRALKRGIAELIEHPQLIETFFTCSLDVSAEEALKIRQVFEAKPPNVIHQFPRKDSKFPLYAIVLGNENQSDRAMGDFGGFVGSQDANLAFIGKGGVTVDTMISTSVYSHTYNVMVYTEHPDVTIYFYYLAKYILHRELEFFKRNGIVDTDISGKDLGPEETYIPDYLFVRRLTFFAKREFQVFADKGERIREVRGIHVNDDNPAHEDPAFVASLDAYIVDQGDC